MTDDRPEDTGPAPDSGRAKRAPPTIDLEASEISGETRKASSEPEPEPVSEPEPTSPAARPGSSAVSAWVIAMVSGAVAASLAIAVAWVLGWPAVPTTPAAAPKVDTTAIDGLAARLASVEAKTSKPPTITPDPAAAARIETLEKSIASLRSELAATRAQSEKLAADAKAATGEPSSSAPDLSTINERIAQIERATRVQGAEIAQENAKPADDIPLRRIVAAALLDVLVRTGDPYPAALAAAKSLTDNADALKPLDAFAASGVPSVATLSRELLALVPKLSPPAPEATTGTGIVDRLQAGAAKLVRIERTDAVGNDRAAIVSRVTAAALRNEMAEARRELKMLPPADRTAAQAWLDKSEARDAALATSRQFATEAMAALAKPRP